MNIKKTKKRQTGIKRRRQNQRTTKNKRRNAVKKGGTIGEINVIEFTDIENIHTELSRTLYREIENYKDKLIYFSLGSKFNESIIKYGIGEKIQTNSVYQMIPYFLYEDSINRLDDPMLCAENAICNCLCIIMDSFSPEELDNNINEIRKNFGMHSASNIKIYILNTYRIMNERDMFLTERIVRDFCDELITQHIPSHQFMLCNYIKFKLEIEHSYEKSIKDMLYSILQEKHYENSYYEWFGYRYSGNYLLYDFIYRPYFLNTEYKISTFLLYIKDFVKTAILQGKIPQNIPRNEQIYLLTKEDYKSFIHNDILKYIYPITPIHRLGDITHINNAFSYSLYNTIE